MKVIAIFALVIALLSGIACMAQPVTVHLHSAPMRKFLSAVKKQTGYAFFYRDEDLAGTRPVTIDVRNVTIGQAMEFALRDQPLRFDIEGRTIVLSRKIDQPQSDAPRLKGPPSKTVINGTIESIEDTLLVGGTVSVSRSGISVPADSNGHFSIKAQAGDTLRVSFIGYQSLYIPVTSALLKMRAPLLIKLQPAQNPLDDIQVIAYGATTHRLNTGAQTTITAGDIAGYPTNNALDVLQAIVPGMKIVRSGGKPGSAYSVQLRGKSGLAGGSGSQPLYIVDGIPYQGGAYYSQNETTSFNPGFLSGDAMNLINPADIEAINVLKDAEATSIYGSRGSNGVVLITTKKGRPGPTRVDCELYSGIAGVERLPHLLNTRQYLEMREQALKNDNNPVLATTYDLNGVWDTTRSTNWARRFIGGTATVNCMQLGISSGTPNLYYLLSGNYSSRGNPEPLGGGDRTASGHFSITGISADKKLTVQLAGGYLYNNNSLNPFELAAAINIPPDAPSLYTPGGYLNFQDNTFNNPLVNGAEINNTVSTNILLSILLNYRIAQGLELKALMGYNKQEFSEFLGYPISSVAPFYNAKAGSADYSWNTVTSLSVEPQLNYSTGFARGHVNATVGTSLQQETDGVTELDVTGISNDALIGDIAAGTGINPRYFYQRYKFEAVFGRLGYNLLNKFLLQGSGRFDGSSNFGENRRFHLFGAASAGWIFSEEKAIRDKLPFLSFGKLRVSYGSTGNDQIGAYSYFGTLSPNGSQYQGVAAVIPTGLSNPDLSWETTRKAELGIEFGFLHNAISLEADFYRNRTVGLLGESLLSTVTGFTSITANLPGITQNDGWELVLRTSNLRAGNFYWRTAFSLSIPHSRLIKSPYGGLTSNPYPVLVGQPVNIAKVYQYAGVNPQTGLFQFADAGGQITSSPSTTTATVNLDPRWFGAMVNHLEYGHFKLDFTFRFIKETGFNDFQGEFIAPGYLPFSIFTDQLSAWHKPGDKTAIQRPGSSSAVQAAFSTALKSTFIYRDDSYCRLQNVSLAYRFSKPALGKWRWQDLTCFLRGQDLFTITSCKNIDPETQNASNLPSLAVFVIGVQATL